MGFQGVQQYSADEIIVDLTREYFLENPPLLMLFSNYVVTGADKVLSDFNEIVTAGFERRLLDEWTPVVVDADGAYTQSNDVTNKNEEPFNIDFRGWAVLDGIDNTKVLAWWSQFTSGNDLGPGAQVKMHIRWRNRSWSNTPD